MHATAYIIDDQNQYKEKFREINYPQYNDEPLLYFFICNTNRIDPNQNKNGKRCYTPIEIP
jgi:hypothetical protein